MRPLLLLLAVLIQLSAVEDAVLLKNGQRIPGVIDFSVATNDGRLAIRTEKGLVRLRADLVDRVEEGYASRRAKVRDDDASALTALARWCLGEKDRDHAVELLALASKRPDCPLEALGLYAQLIDEDSPEQALPLYQQYRVRGGTDLEILARLKELEAAMAAHFGTGTPATTETAKPVALSDGFEARGFDVESPQWSNPAQVKVIAIASEQGTNQVIEIAYTAGDKDKTAVKRQLRGIATGDNGELKLYVFNRDKHPVRLALALKTGNYIYHESRSVTVPVGEQWQEIRFPLRAKDWKSQASSWAHSSEVADLEDIKELQFLIYNGKVAGTLLLDGIDFVKAKDL
mgnify:CR=1 FL=1